MTPDLPPDGDHDAAPDDDRLLADLAGAHAARGLVTERMRADARAAFSWRTIDEELLTLSFDSAETPTSTVRSGSAVRVFGFAAGDFTLEVEHDAGTLSVQLVGLDVHPRLQLAVHDRAGEQQRSAVDESGFWAATRSTDGPVRLVVLDGDRHWSTPWLTL